MQATNYDCEEYFYHKILELCKAGDSNQSAKLLDCLELAEVKKIVVVIKEIIIVR